MNRAAATSEHPQLYLYLCWEFYTKSERGAEKVFEEIMAGNIPNLMRNMNLQIQEVPQTPMGQNKKDTHLETSSLLKDKNKDKTILSAARNQRSLITVRRTIIRSVTNT